MKHLDYITLTERLNKFRMEHQSKTYTREEILKELKKLGISSVYANELLSKKLIPFEKVGKAYLYSFDSNPIHKSSIENLYTNRQIRRMKSSTNNVVLNEEEKAIKKLTEAGYQIRKCIGFDLERFQKENPVLYKRYLKYEIV